MPLQARCLLGLTAVAAASKTAANREGVVIYLTDGSSSRIEELSRSLRSLDYHSQSRWPHPVIIFYENSSAPDMGGPPPLLPDQQTQLRAATSSSLTFAPVDFSPYAAAPGAVGAPALLHGKSLGYRHMCRFFAGAVAHHPALAPFRYYWRLDTDTVLLTSPASGDVFEAMAAHAWRYAHAALQCDWTTVTEGLWELALDHFQGAQGFTPTLETLFRDGRCPKGDGPGGIYARDASLRDAAYNSRVYYNNWEVVDLAFLRSARYGAFFAAADASGRFYTSRWGDAPLRTLAVQALLPAAAVHHFRGHVYWHQSLLGLDVELLCIGGAVGAGLAAALVCACCDGPRRRVLVCSVAAARSSSVAAAAQLFWRVAEPLMSALLCLPRRQRLTPPQMYDGGAAASSVSIYVQPLHDAPASCGPMRSDGAIQQGVAATRLGLRRVASVSSPRGVSAEPRLDVVAACARSSSLTASGSFHPATASMTAPRGAVRFCARSGAAVLLCASVALLASQSRLAGSAAGDLSAGLRAPALRCACDDLPCLMDSLADPAGRHVVVTVVSTASAPLLANFLASWVRAGEEDAAAPAMSRLKGDDSGAPLEEAVAPHAESFGLLVAAADAVALEEARALGLPVYWDPAPLDFLDSLPLPPPRGRLGQPPVALPSSAALAGLHVSPTDILRRAVLLGYSVLYAAPDTVWTRRPFQGSGGSGGFLGAAASTQASDRGGVGDAGATACGRLALGAAAAQGGSESGSAETCPAVASQATWATGVVGPGGLLDPGFVYFRGGGSAESPAAHWLREAAAAQLASAPPPCLCVRVLDPAIVQVGSRGRAGGVLAVRPSGDSVGSLASPWTLLLHDHWQARLWRDGHVAATTAIALAWVGLRTAFLSMPVSHPA